MNKPLAISLCLLFPLLCHAQYRDSGYAELYDSETAGSMRSQVGYFASPSMEGRAAGSDGEKRTAEYIVEEFASYGLDLLCPSEGSTFGIKMENSDTLTSRNVMALLKGYDKDLSREYIVIGARMDNLGTRTYSVNSETRTMTFYGANGNASGLSILLHLAQKLSTNRILCRRSIIFIGFGASLHNNAGAWYFLNRTLPRTDNIAAMINLDMLGTASRGFYAYTCSNPDMNNILDVLTATLQPALPRLVSKEPVQSDHRAFYDKQIPSIFFTTGMYPEYNTDKDIDTIVEYDGMERIAEYIYNFTIKLAEVRRPDFGQAATSGSPARKEKVIPYHDCDVKPTFLGSPDPTTFLKKWVYVYLRYPNEAVENGIQGRVLVDFIIDEKGKVRDVTVRKGVDELLDDEAIRVISASPDWKPAKVGKEKVKSSMSLYVEFRLKRRN